ncbi:MAG: Prophage endopeptidase tail [Bacteriophage sp.]|nr:MAG: Prophage endopeptidase tail [Bacteriophage sp.]UWI02440.1 MAG: Prophage endopeptidase tail [Bacteriophage sp.]
MGTNIIITQPNGNRVPMQNRRTATGITSAKQNWGLNAEDTVDITIESPFPQTYNIGDKITVFGRDYKLNRLPSVKKTGMHQFQYTLQFEGVQYDLFRITYDLTVDTTTNELQDVQGDTLTGNLHRFMTVLIANANRVFPGKWKLGACPDTIGDKTLTFGESDNCLSVLQNLCEQSNFNVEFEIVQSNGVYTVNLYERVGQTLPFTFEYGKGRGLYDLHRENVSSSNIVTRLKVYGSTENITSKYRADRLCLPGKTKGQSYIEKPEMVAKYGVFEGRKNFDDVKPTFTGSVESVVDTFSFIDKKFPFDLNATNASGETLYLINGVSAKIHFNTGNLAGYDFEVKSYDHATHKFTLVKTTDDRGDVFPSETSMAFQFGVGNEYKILDVAYPSDIEAEAEAKLAEVGNKYYDQNCQPKVQYGLSVTKAFLEKLVGTNDSVTNFFAPGDFLHVVDADIDVDKAIRIKSFVRNILDPYDYTLTISDITTNATITNRVISDLAELDKIVTINNLKDPARARANWRSSREVLNMVFDPDGDYYTDKIKPGSIDTLALSVGAKSMQFGLINTVFQPNYNGNPRLVKWQGGVLTHYTIKEESAVSWVMADGQTTLTGNNSAYYLYAKCERNGNAGVFIFTTSQIKVEDDVNYYHFLVGTLSSIDQELNVRSLALTYGFTMVNGRFIKTGRIESADGTTYFDLDNSEIGGRIVFSSNGQKKTLEELGKESLENKDFINNTLPGILSEIQSQLDGQIEQFFETYDPTLTNAPAKDWTTNQMKENHLGDLFYNTESGKVFRFIKNGSVYSWQVLQDSEVAQALALANDALALAKTKRRIFTSTPYTPYEVGDLWVQGGSGDIMRCKTSRATGSYTSSDWEKASKYTDNTELNKFINGTYNNAIIDLTNQIDGKIETWFQTTDPASSWTTTAMKAKHVGDMWYHSTQKKLKRYSSSYSWVNIEDQKAIDAYEAANNAQDTADGKRRVFVSTPYPPYDIGDLWVNGKDLRRCQTKKTQGQSYNINDWVVAVDYDNTKTVIDGGLVTSGTIQVAGDNKSILAGMTGQGTAASSIRFWAGASFENRATAPYRVMQDGSVVMTKATVEGVINAISGYIGGFRIQQGQIGYGSSSEQDTTRGLALLNNFIRFYNGSQRTLVGCLSSLGYPYNALFELSGNMGTTVEIHRDGYNESNEVWYKPKALAVFGNQLINGKLAVFEKGYIGEAYSDSLENYIHLTHSYVFHSISSSYREVRLPKLAPIWNNLGGMRTFSLHIQITWLGNKNRIRLSGVDGGHLVDNNANRPNGGYGWIDMAQGDSVILRAYASDYYLVQYRT